VGIVGVGIDLIEVERVARALERWGDRFVDKIMGPEEAARLPQEPPDDRVRALALAVAAKEAASKALGTGWTRGVSWRHVVVDIHTPAVRLEKRAAAVASRLGGTTTRTWLEIRGGLALAQVRLVS
jgi:holo-[acyl-carrier protein] synthase